LRLEPASAPCSGRSTRSRKRARYTRSVGGELVGGSPRPCRDSRRPCYSPLRCRATSMDA
jgi:hypothetical protein